MLSAEQCGEIAPSAPPFFILPDLLKKSSMNLEKELPRLEKVFLLSILRIPYLLLHKYTSATRYRFTQEYPYLAKLYNYLLKLIGREIELPVKICEECGISYLPDCRTKKHQKYCPYGCVELNRRRNRQKAKSRYRRKREALLKASKYNCLYRERKKNGQVTEMPEVSCDIEEVERKLRAQIKFFYKKLNPALKPGKLEQLDRILEKLSQRMAIP